MFLSVDQLAISGNTRQRRNLPWGLLLVAACNVAQLATIRLHFDPR